MDRNLLTYHTSPAVVIGTNTFINVPIILQVNGENLIEIIKEENLEYTTSIPIYNRDGTYLAKAKGTRLFLTEAGKSVGLRIVKEELLWVAQLENQTLFEIRQQPGDSFKLSAELYTPDGLFVKSSDRSIAGITGPDGKAIQINGMTMTNSTFENLSIGIRIKGNQMSIGVV